MTAVSAKLSLDENFVMFALIQVTKYCFSMVLNFMGDVITKSSVSDKIIITFITLRQN